MYYKTLYINLFSTLRFSFYSPLFLPLFFFFCHQHPITPFVSTVYTFLYFLPLFLPLLFFFATFEPKRKKEEEEQMVVAKVKTRVKSAVNTVMTQFVRLWWQKKWQSGKKKAKRQKNCRNKMIMIIIRILILISMIFRFYFNTMSLLRKAMYQYCCRLRGFIINSANHWC